MYIVFFLLKQENDTYFGVVLSLLCVRMNKWKLGWTDPVYFVIQNKKNFSCQFYWRLKWVGLTRLEVI